MGRKEVSEMRKYRKPKRESKIEAYLVRACSKRGWSCWKFASPGRKGVPDRIILIPGGKAVFIEVKSPEGQLSKLQGLLIEKLSQLGFLCFVVASYEEVDNVLGYIEEKRKDAV
jgi:hypothetical protein